MEDSTKKAKKMLLINIASNIANVFIGSIINIWLTSFLIRDLGVKVYGMIPLTYSLVSYFQIFSGSIATTVSRFAAIHLSRNEIEESNVYYNSAIRALLIVSGILLIPVFLISFFFSKIFQVPSGFEVSSSWLCLLVIFSSFIMAATGPFRVATFVRHRFDLNNVIQILSKLLQVAIIIISFKLLAPSLVYFGISYLVMSLFLMFGFFLTTRILVPQLDINLKLFKWSAILQMSWTNGWILIDQVGMMFYLGIGFPIINVLLGPEQGGRYAPVAQLVTLLLVLGASMSDVFAPIVYKYIADNQLNMLSYQIRRSVNFLALIMALPIGLLCGLAAPLLTWWLGPSFADLSALVWVLLIPWLVTIAAKPIFAVFRGMDKVKCPAIASLVIGVVNVIMSVLLVKFTGLGIYGVALSLGLCLISKDFLIVPVYAAIITNQPKQLFFKAFIPGFIMTFLVSMAALFISRVWHLSSLLFLLTVCILVSAVYCPFCYFIILKEEDRSLLLSLIRQKDKTPKTNSLDMEISENAL